MANRFLSTTGWLLLAGVLFTGSPAAAAFGDVDNVERKLLGWTDDGEKLVVRMARQGERMVNKRSKDFYFRLTEIRNAETGERVDTYRYEEASGASHPEFENAKSQKKGAEFLEKQGLVEGEERWHSPDGRMTLTTYSRSFLEKTEKTRRGTQWVCKLEQRLVLIDEPESRTYVLESWTERGDRSKIEEEAPCPETALSAYWHPESSHWAVIRQVSLSGAKTGPPTVYADSTKSFEDYGKAVNLRPHQPLAKWVEQLKPKGLVEGYRALHRGEFEEAKDKFQALAGSDGDDEAKGPALFGLARAHARLEEERESRKRLGRALELGGETPWAYGQAAAVYRLLDDQSEFERNRDAARKKAESRSEFVRIAELFRYVDLGVANDFLLAALKTKGGDSESAAYDYAYGLLVEGLIDASLYEKADILFEKLESLTPRMKVQKLRSEMERTDPDVGDERGMETETAELLFEHPGVCLGYLLYGRSLAHQGRLGEAQRQFRAVNQCDPALPDAYFYLGAIELRTGDWSSAESALASYLRLALERRQDGIRPERRALAERYLKRIQHEGAVLTTVKCETGPFGKLRCRGVVENTSDEELEGVGARAVQPVVGEQAALTTTVIGTIPPGESRSFVLRPPKTDLAKTSITAGRDDEERELNRTPAIFD